MGDIVIAAYRSKHGCEAALAELVADHTPHLRRLGLATERPSARMRAADGTIVEVFAWRDGGIAAARRHPEVLALRGRYAEVCDYVPLKHVAETAMLFAQFAPV